MKICIASWSLRNYVGRKFPLAEFPQVVKAKYSVASVELAQMHFQDFSLGVTIPTNETSFLDEIKRGLEQTGCVLVNLPIDIGHVSQLDEKKKRFDLDVIKGWMKVARYLGSRAIRVNTESVITRERKGQKSSSLEMAIESYTELATYAKELNLKLLLENHGGLSGDPQNIIKIVEAVAHSSFGLCADFGNFDEAVRYRALEIMAPYVWLVHAKTYDFDENGEVPEYDFSKCLAIFRDNGFDGFVSVEFEGQGEQYEGVQRTIDLVHKYW